MSWTGDDKPPPGWMRLREVGTLVSHLPGQFGHLDARGPIDGPPALVIPGFVANDHTTLELRKAMADGGWRVHGWGLGWNLGVRADTLDRLEDCLDRLDAQQPVLVVGWSLGGLYARELARRCPAKVRAVVSLGSPISGDLHQNNVWRLYELVAGHKIDHTPIARVLDQPPVPTLSIWSRQDGIIAPRAAYGIDGERDRAIEIDSSHMGFAVSRQVTRRVVQEIDTFLKSLD
ncbi:MAG TPA: alpha/beta hydrolase [Sphingomicrobium sp.]|nr:alpha/beta hydrolase [Sphingomicrobium sp.]